MEDRETRELVVATQRRLMNVSAIHCEIHMAPLAQMEVLCRIKWCGE